MSVMKFFGKLFGIADMLLYLGPGIIFWGLIIVVILWPIITDIAQDIFTARNTVAFVIVLLVLYRVQSLIEPKHDPNVKNTEGYVYDF
jgi:hypothetical protein